MQRWRSSSLALGTLMLDLAGVVSPAYSQSAAGGARPAGAVEPPKITRPGLFFKEEWKQAADGGEHGVTQESVGNPNLELKLYVPAGEVDLTGKANDENNPIHVWTGLCTSPCAVAFREKKSFADLSGFGRIRWTTK